MVKLFVLLFLFLSTMASMAGYLYLDKKIAAGEIQIAEGERQIEKGQSDIEQGMAKLDAGKRELSEGKEKYAKAQAKPFLVLLDNVFKDGEGFKEGRDKIADGDKQVAKGERDLDVGEKRLDEGKLELSQGQEQLSLAKTARISCAIVGVLFALLSIVFGFCWRKTLIRFFRHGHA
jgi:chromosome segregation ATPase